MMTLIIGGSKCGKSSFGEKILADRFPGEKIYIATMRPFGEEAFQAIERHKKMRKGKNFLTIEKYTDIHEIALKRSGGVLLECVGNLCANEMFSGETISDPAEKIVRGITYLSEYPEHLVVISNNISGDGITYTPETELYIKSMSKINNMLAEKADNVIECVYGIPILLKGALQC